MQSSSELYVIPAAEARRISEEKQKQIQQIEIQKQKDKEPRIIQNLQDVFGKIQAKMELGLQELELDDKRQLNLDEQRYLRTIGYIVQDVVVETPKPERAKCPRHVLVTIHQKISW